MTKEETTMTNAECIKQLSNEELDHQISEACKELRVIDRSSPAYDGSVEDLREMFIERKHRRQLSR